MTTHHEEKDLPHSPQQMFDLVADVARYPEFLPWTAAARIRSRQPLAAQSDPMAEVMEADLVISFKLFREKFGSRVTLLPTQGKILTQYLDGPLRDLKSEWRFLPGENGPQSCKVVFVTAHHQHALKAFRYNAIDYLLKPLQLSELQRALDKVSLSMPLSKQQWQSAQKQLEEENWSRIAVSGHNGIIFLELPDILYAEAINNYTKIFTLQGKQITTAKTLKDVQETLSDSMFVRIHRQFLVNIKHIRQFNRGDNSITMINGETLPVSRSQKDLLLEKFKWL
jgi:two-component system LytT family response regulator